MRTRQGMFRRAMAAALCLLLLLTLASASLCVACLCHHSCNGEGCAICDCVSRCGELLRALGQLAAVPYLPVLAVACMTMAAAPCLVPATLASQRVRMND